MKPHRQKHRRPAWSPEPEYLAERWEGVSLEEVLHRLRSRKKKDRVWAAVLLRSFGPEVQPDLIQALKDRDLKVRVAAAQSLGYVGDYAAVGPLTQALQTTFLGRSPLWQNTTGCLVLVVGMLLLGVGFYGWLILKIESLALLTYLVVLIVAGVYLSNRAAAGLFVRAAAGALGQIAEREPTPELRTALHDLKVASTDVFHLDGSTRQVSKQAATKIESLTEQLKNLPLPTGDPEEQPASLPRPASAPITYEEIRRG